MRSCLPTPILFSTGIPWIFSSLRRSNFFAKFLFRHAQTVYKSRSRTMQNELDVIRDIAEKFAQAGIEYMLTGSVALNYYSQPRMTRDIDVVVALKPKDLDLVTALFESDYYVDRNAVSRALANESLFNIIHSEAFIKVDCIVRKNTEYRRLEFEKRREVTV